MTPCLFDGTAFALKGYREQLGMSLHAAATRAGVTVEVWQSWEEGAAHPEAEHWPAIHTVLCCSEIAFWLCKVEIEAAHYGSHFEVDPEIVAAVGARASWAVHQILKQHHQRIRDGAVMIIHTLAMMRQVVEEEMH